MRAFIYRITLICYFFLIGVGNIFCQLVSPNVPTCGFDEMNHQLWQEHPHLKKEIDKYLEEAVPKMAAKEKSAVEELLTISVVVHVIHSGEPIGQGSNISDQQVIDQIGILNDDYCSLNRKYFDTPPQWMGLAGTPNIQFLLATVDPNGNPTSGIDRHNIPVTGSSWNNNNINSEIKPAVNWDPNRYMNIYVVSIPGTTSAGGVVGYSNYPTISLIGADRDGPVIDYNWFGGPGHPVSGYRAITHETGHYLGLPHPFNGTSCNADDGIDDTPNADDATSSYVTLDCSNGFPMGPVSCTEEHMYVNYMDYVDENCYTSFSQGQVNVMRSVLDGTSSGFGYGSREELLINAPSQTVIPNHDAGITRLISPEQTNCTADQLTPIVTLRNFGIVDLIQTTINYQIDDGPLTSFIWQGSLFPGESTNVELPPFTPPNGVYTVNFFSKEPNGQADERIWNDTLQSTILTYFSFDPPLMEWVDGASSFPTPLGTYEFNFGNDDFAWEISYDAAAYGYGTQSFAFNNRAGNVNNNPSDTYDLLITRHFDFSEVNSAALYFDVAYAPFNAFQTDTLYILVATGCSQNFNTYVYKKWGTDLATAPATEDLFVPTPEQWRTEGVDLSFFDGQDDVTIGFLNVSSWGNQLFIDNIRVGVDCGLVTAEWDVTPDGCDTTSCSGEATINIPISNGNVAYEWEGIPTSPTQSSVSNLCAGNVTVTVTDEFGCQIITENEIPGGDVLELGGTSSNETFCGENGSVTVWTENGIAPFTFIWSNGVESTSTTNIHNIYNLAAGEYTVTVTDATHCANIFTTTVGETPSDLTGEAGIIQNISCQGEQDGVASASAVSSYPPYTFSWSNGMNNQTISDLSQGIYIVTISDGTACEVIDSIEIIEPEALALSISSTPLSSANANDATAIAEGMGGTPGYSYNWSTGSTTAMISGLEAGTYTVTISDANNCTRTESVTIQSVDCSDFQTTISWENLNCFESNDGTAMVEVSGETPPVTYAWSNGATASMIENLSADTYSVTVMDADGCSAELSAMVQQPQELTVSLTSTNETMPGASDGTATAIPDGGTPDYTYLWINGETSATISGLMPGTYTVTITDFNDCTISSSITVAGTNCSLSIEMDFTNASCPNVADGSASVTEVFTGTAPFTYNWSNGGTEQTIESLLPGDYFVTVSDVNGCTANGWVPLVGVDNEPPTLILLDQITLEIENNPVMFNPSDADDGSFDNCSMINFEASQTEFDCDDIGSSIVAILGSDQNGNSATGIITVIIEDKMAPEIICPDHITVDDCEAVNYPLPDATDNCNTPILNLIGGLESGSAFPSGTTTVEWEATDMNGNSSNCSFEIVVNYEFQLTNSIVVDPTCAGDDDGFIDLFIEGGVAPYQSIWSHGGGPTNLSAGEYSVTITDSNGCTVVESFELQDPAAISIEVIEIIPAMGGVPTGSIQLSVLGGDPPITVEWYENGNLLPDFDPFAAPPGTYTVQVTDYNNCITDGGPYLVDNLNSAISNNLERSISIYPNPTDEEFILEIKNHTVDNIQLSIHDLTGKFCLQKHPLKSASSKIDVSELSQGIYWIKIISGNKMAWKKLVIF